MKKIDLILNGKVDAKLIDTKKAKITKAIEVGILNAEDDLLGKELDKTARGEGGYGSTGRK